MNSASTPIIIEVGGVRFKCIAETILAQPSCLQALIRNSPPAPGIQSARVYYVDRDPLMFPLVLNYLRGYTIKPSMIKNLLAESDLDQVDFYAQLYEDVTYYAMPGLIEIVETLLYEECPSLIKDIEKVEKMFETDPLYLEKKEKLFIKIQGLCREITENNMEVESEELAQLVLQHSKLTVRSPLHKLEEAASKLQDTYEFINFTATARTTMMTLISYILMIFSGLWEFDLRPIHNKIYLRLAHNMEVMKELYTYFKRAKTSPFVNFFGSSVMSIIFEILMQKRMQRVQPSPEEMEEMFRNVQAPQPADESSTSDNQDASEDQGDPEDQENPEDQEF